MNKTKNQRFSKEDFFALKRKNLLELEKLTQVKTKSMLRRFFGIGLIFTFLICHSVQAYPWTDASNTDIATGKSITADAIREIRDVAGEASVVYEGGVTHLKNLLQEVGSSSETGTLKITMPTTWDNTMHSVRITGYNYTGNSGAWEVLVSGYNYAPSTVWVNTSAKISGKAPFDNVRLAHDGTNNVILLGDTSTAWSHPKIFITDVYARGNREATWKDGWSIDYVTSEAGISNVNTPSKDTNFYGKVGIGTTAPAAKLDVAGSINATGNLVTGGSVTVGNNVSSSLTSRHIYGKSNTSNATDTLYLNYNTGANVNVGGGGQLSNLAVSGHVTSGQVPTSGTHLTNKSYVDSAITTGGDDLGDHTATENIKLSGNWLSNDGDNEGIRVTSTGNVGIGTITPTDKLHVNGNVRLEQGDKVNLGSSANYIGSRLSGNLDLLIGAQNDMYLTVDANDNDASGDFIFGTDAIDESGDNYQELVRIQANGNVGIGTTSPEARLDVAGSINTSGNILTGGSITVGNNVSSSLKSLHIYGKDNTSNTIGSLYLNYNTGENVNIGTGPTKSNLIVGGNASAATPTAASHLTTKAYVDSAVSGGGDDLGNHTATQALDMGSNAITGVTTMATSGNITTQGTLISDHSYGTSNSASRVFSAGITSASGGNIVTYGPSHSTQPNDIRFRTSSTTQMTIDGATGNIGIGTIAPSSKLEVVGNIEINGNDKQLKFSGTSGPMGLEFVSGEANLVYRTGANQIHFENASDVSQFSIDIDDGRAYFAGNVGIGTGSPSAELEVNGDIKADAFINTSDRSLKDNIKTTNGLETIKKLRGVNFTWKETGNASVGLIAQEIENVLPELVRTDPTTGLKAVEYANMVAPLIEAVKEQQAQIEVLQKEIEVLKNK